jgi:hypothetical protein
MTTTPYPQTAPAPGSARAVHARNEAAEQGSGQHVAETAAPAPQPARHPVPVIRSASAHGNYYTVMIPASAAGIPSVAQLLPQDAGRVVAYILPIDNAIVIATSKEQAQDPANVGGAYPGGTYAPPGGYPVTHSEQVWAANTSTSGSCRVSVMVETGGGT